jgi:hypothetical protein
MLGAATTNFVKPAKRKFSGIQLLVRDFDAEATRLN